MNIGRILFLAIFLFSASTILSSGSFVEKIINDYSAEINSQTALLDQQTSQIRLKQEYRSQLLEVLEQFSGEDVSYQNLEEELLTLTVPLEYKDLHLSLVTAVDQLASNQQVVPAKTKLEELKKAYIWLAANLSLFIANNF